MLKIIAQFVVILAMAGLVSPSFGGPAPTLRKITQKDYDAIVAQRHEQLQQFNMRIGAAKTGCEPSAEMDLAIKGLGEFRAAEYEGQLSRHLMYLPEKLTADDRFTTEMYYPAALAIVQIGGRRSVASMVWKIAATSSSDERNLATWVIMSIEGKEQATHRFDDLIARNDAHKSAYTAAKAFLVNYKLTFELPTRKPLPENSLEYRQLPYADNDTVLGEIAPAEYDAYRKSLQSGYEPKTVNAALSLVAKVEYVADTVLSNRNASQKKIDCARIAPNNAWTLLLEAFHKTADANAKRDILAAWDKGLDRPKIRPMILALLNEWDKAFMTDRLKKRFAAEKEANLVGEICFVLGQHGEDAEEALLREKRVTLKSMNFDYSEYICCLNSINDALTKIGLWRSGNVRREAGSTVPYPEIWPF